MPAAGSIGDGAAGPSGGAAPTAKTSSFGASALPGEPHIASRWQSYESLRKHQVRSLDLLLSPGNAVEGWAPQSGRRPQSHPHDDTWPALR